MIHSRSTSTWRRLIGAVATLFLSSGAGQVVLGRYRRAILWILLTIPIFVALGLGLALDRPGLLWTAMALGVACKITAVSDVARVAPSARLPGWGLVIGVWLALLGLGACERALLWPYMMESSNVPPSSAMIPALQVGDHFLINKVIYRMRQPPRRGEVIAFTTPQRDKVFIKRIVAVAGDMLDIKAGRIYVNGQPLPKTPLPGPCEYEDYAKETQKWKHERCEAFREVNGGIAYTIIHTALEARGAGTLSYPVTVPPGHVFVMGDNRDSSFDSRFMGALSNDLIKGRADFIWWSSGARGTRWERIRQRIQ